jgi:hypothetical protein
MCCPFGGEQCQSRYVLAQVSFFRRCWHMDNVRARVFSVFIRVLCQLKSYSFKDARIHWNSVCCIVRVVPWKSKALSETKKNEAYYPRKN